MQEKIHSILLKYWRHKNFRALQEDIINSVLEKKDTLALLPTGGGKSVCFQVPAMAMDGICIVVSPLIALMHDQVENLKKKEIKALCITSAMRKSEIDIALDNCIHGDFKFLYVSPERLETDIFKVRVQQMNVNLIAVDEAHCVSQWGYDFRPSYLKIAELRKLLPNTPLLALTATATPEVVKDIQEKLEFKSENVFQKSFERKNVAYVVSKDENKLEKLLKICRNVSGSGIVYVRNRKKTVEISKFLQQNKITSDFYHAGLDSRIRQEKQKNWIENKTRIIVCTNAFGMGIDKPDVRIVIHIDLPESPEAYFQEAGRAGRDEKKSFAVLIYNEHDILELKKSVKESYPTVEEIKIIYNALGNYYQLAVGSGERITFDFDISDFSNRYNLNANKIFNCLKILERESYILTSDSFFEPAKIIIKLSQQELYKYQVENAKHDDFTKLLLRSYSGLFEQYTKINEADLALRSQKTKEETIALLKHLHTLNILEYIPQSNSPKITFVSERVSEKNFYISNESLRKRKEKALERMNAIISYATSTHQCRSRMLLAYFGEKETYRCGICDVCLERNKLELNDVEFEEIKNEIKKALTKESVTITTLSEKIKGIKEEKLLKVVQWLADEKELEYNLDNKIGLKHEK